MTENIRVCRACLSSDNKLYILSENSIDDCFSACLGISVPSSCAQHICYICLHVIKKFMLFREQCIYSGQILHKIITGKELSLKYNKPNYFKYQTTIPEIKSYLTNITQDTSITETYNILSDDKQNDMKIELQNDESTNKSFEEHFCDESVIEEVCAGKVEQNDMKIELQNDESTNKSFEEHFCDESVIEEVCAEKVEEVMVMKCFKGNFDLSKRKHLSEPDLPKDKNSRKLVSYKGSKLKKCIEETSVNEEFDEKSSENYKNALLLYNLQPNIKNNILKKRVAILDKFSKTYMVDIKVLTQEEQKREIEKRQERHQNAPYNCQFCNRGYNTRETFEAHMSVHDASAGDYVCNTCGIRSRTARDRAKHINLSHLKRFTCKLCGKITRSQFFAKAHFLAKHNDDGLNKNKRPRKDKKGAALGTKDCGTHSCEICGDLFNSKFGLSIHMGVVHKQAIRCKSCEYVFENSMVLNKHICQTGVSPCPSCGVNFPSEKVMKKHREEKHKTNFQCYQCDKTFTSRMEYKMHRNKHNKGKEDIIPGGRILCEICGKRNFKSFIALHLHQRVHTDERPFTCNVCQKTFRYDSTLRSHLTMHTDDRRYKCTICDKAFKQSAHRAAHLLTHTNERPYSCSACPKRYTSATSLKEHTNTAHRGLPPRRRRKTKVI